MVTEAGPNVAEPGGPEVVAVFAALGDETRSALLTELVKRGSGSATSLAAGAPISRQAVDRHLRVLAQAGLLESRRQGREVVYTLAPEALAKSADWLDALGRSWERKLRRVKEAAEGPADRNQAEG